MIFGIDVSEHQGVINWPVAARGIAFAIARASIARRVDDRYAANIAAIRRAGLVPGAYHFLYAGNATAQADVFIKTIGDPTGLLTVLDVERDGTSEPQIDDVHAFVARWRAVHPEHPLVIYTGGWYWRGYMANPAGADLGPLWASHYVEPTNTLIGVLFEQVTSSWWKPGFGGWAQVSMLQFSSSAVMPGVAGRCDVDAFPGTADELRLLAAGLPSTDTEDLVQKLNSNGLLEDGRPVTAVSVVEGAKFTTVDGVVGTFSGPALLPVFAYVDGDDHSYLVVVHTKVGWTDGVARDTPVILSTNQPRVANPKPAPPVDTTPYSREQLETTVGGALDHVQPAVDALVVAIKEARQVP